MMRVFLSALILLITFPLEAEEVAQSFPDLLPEREEFSAVEDLKGRAILVGRPDGSFGPDDFVNRAEAITIVVRAVANVHNLPSLDACFPDVHGEEWYVRTVCYAEDLGWVSGYPDGTFQPVRTVSKVEFLKILFNAYGVDTDPLELFRDPLSQDVKDPAQWYFPYLSYALASSMTHADESANLNPGIALTRGQVALLLHRFLLYREGERTQTLMMSIEEDMRSALERIAASEFVQAEFSVSRARVSVWGAVKVQPKSAALLALQKTADALSLIVRAEKLYQEKSPEAALASSQEAYILADAADAVDLSVKVHTDQIRYIAHELAESIRAEQNVGTSP